MISKFYIKNVRGKGRGVFTDEFIPEGELIESSPVVPVPRCDLDPKEDTILDDYYFEWNERTGAKAMALGYGSMYNHSYRPNMECVQETRKRCLNFYALRDINPGEELVYNYNPDLEEMWFEVVE